MGQGTGAEAGADPLLRSSQPMGPGGLVILQEKPETSHHSPSPQPITGHRFYLR